MFVLGRFDETKADHFREPFRFACAAVDVNAMFVLDTEIDLAAREFAQKFADMKRRHVVLFGDDPLAKVSISRDVLVRRLQQTLLNLTMRLREMYVQRSLREEQCAVTIAETTGPLRTAAATILELEGRGTLAPKEALYTFVHDLGPSDFIDLLQRKAGGARAAVRKPIEQALRERRWNAVDASSLFSSVPLKAIAAQYETQLAAEHLIPDNEIKGQRRAIYLGALAVLLFFTA